MTGSVQKLIAVFTLLPILFLVQSSLASAQQAPIWQVGTFDESSLEFSDRATGELLPDFVVGKSKASDWYGFQPGSSNGRYGGRPHPRSINFDLAGQPNGVYKFKVGLIVEYAGIPSLKLNINGKIGRFYLQPKLNYTMGNRAAAWFPLYSMSTISVVVPAEFLKSGTNRVTFTAIDEQPAGKLLEDAPPWAGHSGLVYDAISFERNPSEKFTADAVSARIVPTIFYKKTDGKLAEQVDVFLMHNRPVKGTAELALGGSKQSLTLESDQDFGEQKLSVQVPEFSGTTQANLAVTVNGQKLQFDQEIQPARKWTLFIVPNEHLDIGYTDYPAKVAEVHSRVIDEAMDFIGKYPEFRFSLDGFWIAEQFEKGRTAADKERFYQMVKDKKIAVPPQYASLFTQYASSEALIRSFYDGAEFARKRGGFRDYVSITDIPTFSWSYASLMASAGFKYFIAGSNNDASPSLVFGRHHERSPFWWEGPDGQRILMWHSRMYLQVGALFGMPPDLDLAHQSLPIFLQNYQRADYPSDAVILYGTQPENTDLFPQQASLGREWNARYAFPRIEYSSFSEAMDYIVGKSGDSLPVLRGDSGSYWESFNTQAARAAALGRQNEARALSAEKASTVSSIANPRFVPPADELHDLWRKIVLMDEHTWNSSRSVSQPRSRQTLEIQSEKEELAVNARRHINHLLQRSLAALSDQVTAPPNSVVVFNSLNWKRDGLVDFDLDKGWEIVDGTTNQVVPYELYSTTLTRRVRFLATDVPPVGYKTYRLRKSTSEPQLQPVPVLESPFYRVTLDATTGAIRSIYDRQAQRELVNVSSRHRFGQYVYVTGADELPNRLIAYQTTSPLPVLTPHGSANGRIVSISRTPFGTVAKLESSAPNTPRIATEVVLFDKQKKIELNYTVEKAEVFKKEGAYFVFPLAFKQPNYRFENQTTSIDPARDMIKGAGLITFSIQHWIRAKEGDASITVLPLDAPIMAIGDLVRGKFPEEFGARDGTLYSFAMSNYHYDNWPGSQGGEFKFRYVVTSGAGDTADLTRLGWEEATPLEINEVTSLDKAVEVDRPLPAELSFLHIDRPDVFLQTWKPSEDGNGTILRFLDFGDKGGRVNVTVPRVRVKSAWLCSALEENRSELRPVNDSQLSFEMRPHETVTVRLDVRAVE